MFEYIFTPGNEGSILTPFCNDLSQIQKETIMNPGFIHDISIYPNGFRLESLQYHDKIIVKTNMELLDNNDGTFSVKL